MNSSSDMATPLGSLISTRSDVYGLKTGELHRELKARNISFPPEATVGVLRSLLSESISLAWLIIPQAWSWTVFNMTFNSWRLYIALCTLPSLMAGILISFYDESPKFLMSRGHSEEALKVLRKIYAVNTGRHPDTYPVKAIAFEKLQVSQKPTPPPTNTTPFKQIGDMIKSGCKQATPLFKAPHLTSAALVFSIQFGSLLSMNTIRLWMPQLFFIMEDFSKLQAASVDDYSSNSFSICEMLAYTDNIAAVAAANRSLSALSGADTCTVNAVKSTMYLNSVIVGVVTGLFYLFAGSLINALGRKRLLIIGFMISGLCGISIYWSRNANVTIAVIATFLAASSVCGKALISVVVDLFPTSLRAMAVSMTMMFGRSGALLGNLMFPVLLDISCIIPFLLVSGIVIVGGALCFMIPKNFGKNSD